MVYKVLRARSEGEEKEEKAWDLLPFLPFDDFHVSLFFDSIYYSRERERERDCHNIRKMQKKKFEFFDLQKKKIIKFLI